MDIHVVSSGETIESIADNYGVSTKKLIQDNGINPSDRLITGQTIVIVYPQKTYSVQPGDTLDQIAVSNGISLQQLLRNNPFLYDRDYIIPGETLAISYDTSKGKVTTSGFAYPYINKNVLIKTLSYITYLTIFNYTVTENGELITYYDDTEIVKISKDYGVAPLMLLTSLTTTGVPNIEAVYNILTNDELQDKYINKVIGLVKSKEYYGVNISFQYLNTSNQTNYIKLFHKLSVVADREKIPLFITINPNKVYLKNEIVFDKVDYSVFRHEVNSVAFLTFDWAYNFGPPLPIGSISEIKELIEYVTKYISPKEISTGIPILGYDWELPYVVGFSRATALSLDSVLQLARNVGTNIEFDEISQSPYIRYTDSTSDIMHIVWFIDARSINSLMDLVTEYELSGTGVWNIMNYYTQMWLVINSQYEIEKII